jgi:hypothetical protein
MDNWRPDKKVGGNQTGFWDAISFPSVSVKDRSFFVPLVMLNARLTFTWPNKVSFNREASDIIQAGIYTGVRIGAEGVMIGGTKSEPKDRQGLIPGSRMVRGYCGPSCPVTFTWIVSLMICSSLDR